MWLPVFLLRFSSTTIPRVALRSFITGAVLSVVSTPRTSVDVGHSIDPRPSPWILANVKLPIPYLSAAISNRVYLWEDTAVANRVHLKRKAYLAVGIDLEWILSLYRPTRWPLYSQVCGSLGISTNFVDWLSHSEITLREPSNPRETESLNSSSSLNSSTPQQISSPAISPLLNGSTDSHNSRPSRTVSPPCNPTTPQRQLLVQPTHTTPSPNGIILIDLNRLSDLPESPSETKFPRQTQQTQLDDRKLTPEHISNQVTPTGNVNRMPYISTPNGAPLKSVQDTREVEYRHQPENVDLPSTSRTTSDSLSKDYSFPPGGSLTSWSSKDDPSDPRKSLHLGSSSIGSPHGFRFSTTSSNSHPPPDLHMPSSRKSSIALKRGSSGQYNRNRPHIHEKVVSIMGHQ